MEKLMCARRLAADTLSVIYILKHPNPRLSKILTYNPQCSSHKFANDMDILQLLKLHGVGIPATRAQALIQRIQSDHIRFRD